MKKIMSNYMGRQYSLCTLLALFCNLGTCFTFQSMILLHICELCGSWFSVMMLNYRFRPLRMVIFRMMFCFFTLWHCIFCWFLISLTSTDLVCQSGPGSWPSTVYAESAVYPMAHSAAQVNNSPHFLSFLFQYWKFNDWEIGW